MAGRREWSRGVSLALLGGVYAIAFGVGLVVAQATAESGPLWAALLGDLAATVVVFLASVAFDNTSVYDPYWSVAPLPLALWWYAHPGGGGRADPVRFTLAAVLLGLWGIRLTANFVRGWAGLGHEDWRYTAYRRFGMLRYRLIAFAGLQLMPTLVVFTALLPVYALTREPGLGPNWVDGLAAAIGLGAVALEAAADEQKRRGRARAAPGEFVAAGLWAWCRHPNYLGEVAFWWGMFGLGLAAAWGHVWTIAGAVAMTLLFRLISVPLMDRRMAGRYPGYAAFAAATPALLPPPWGRGRRARRARTKGPVATGGVR